MVTKAEVVQRNIDVLDEQVQELWRRALADRPEDLFPLMVIQGRLAFLKGYYDMPGGA